MQTTLRAQFIENDSERKEQLKDQLRYIDDQLERIQILRVVQNTGVSMETLQSKALDVLTAVFNCLAEQLEYFQTIGGKSGIVPGL